MQVSPNDFGYPLGNGLGFLDHCVTVSDSYKISNLLAKALRFSRFHFSSIDGLTVAMKRKLNAVGFLL
jgi:hypothetical protein